MLAILFMTKPTVALLTSTLLKFKFSSLLSHSYPLLILFLYYLNQLSNLFFQGHLWLALTPRRLTAGYISQ